MLAAMSKFVLILLAVAACAGPTKPPAQNGGSGSNSKLVCHEVTDTGTLFSHTECTAPEDSQAQTDDAQRFLKQPRSEPMRGK